MRQAFFILVLLSLLLSACSSSNTDLETTTLPEPNWPVVDPIASYTVNVTLDPETKTLNGKERITYVNNGDASMTDAVFHLYLNAFRDDHSSIFMQEVGPNHRGYTFNSEYPGWIKVTSIRLADGTPLELELIEDETLARAELPRSVTPGSKLELEIEFEAGLPQVFARTGFSGDFFLVGQWFPKLGVWQDGQWNAYPFHANSEFFAEFGNYDVNITVPNGYVIAATGLPGADEANNDGTHTAQYHAQGVIDFVWSASPDFKQATHTVEGVEIVYVYLPEHESTVDRVLYAADAAITNFGDWYGAYPYPRLTVLDVPDEGGGAGGMEYPMLVTAGMEDITGLGIMNGQFDRILEVVTVHEIAHQWWQSVVAFNEAEEPWLDEGFTDYSASRLMDKVYGPANAIKLGGIKLTYFEMRRMEYLGGPLVSMYGKAWEFDPFEYGVAAYSKPVVAMSTLEKVLGEETMMQVMGTFFERYKFLHPTTEDFRTVAEELAGQELDWFFDGLVYGGEVLNYSVADVSDHAVTVQRQGTLSIPTEIMVTFRDGTTVIESWDGIEVLKTFKYPDRPTIYQVVVDPENKILVDLQWSDNGMYQRTDISSWLMVNARIFHQIQDLLLMQGGL